jgi:hypothetical protein
VAGYAVVGADRVAGQPIRPSLGPAATKAEPAVARARPAPIAAHQIDLFRMPPLTERQALGGRSEPRFECVERIEGL